MGSVYLARHAGEAGFQRLFAIKVLHEHLAEKASFVDMLRDEARIAARLHHPNVVAVVDLGTHRKDHYIVMDYVEGPSFSNLWKRSEARLPRELSVSIIIDTLDGLHAAHILKDEHGRDLHLIHRDVSPSNILVGIDGIARITDFGIAKAESRITSTQPGTRKGKLQYMSPEQVEDDMPIDHRTDIWSVGVMLWNVLTGERLFSTDSDSGTIEAILFDEIQPPSTTDANPPEFFDEVVMRALERDPEKRYASALEMGDALRKIIAENNLMSSRQVLAGWVERLFGEDLERRRAEIRKVLQRRSITPITSEHSQVTLLPSLPSPPSFIPIDKMNSSSFSISGNGDIDTAESSIPELWMAARSRKKYLLLSLLLIATILTGVLIIFYYRSTQPSIEVTNLEPEKTEEEQPSSPPAIKQPDLSPVSVSTSQPSEPQSETPQPINKAPEKSFSSKVAEHKDDGYQKNRRFQRRNRIAKRSTTPDLIIPEDDLIHDPTPEPQSISAPESKPSSEPSATPSSDYEFEKNPYIMH